MGNIRKRTLFILLAAACALLVCGAAFLLAGCGGEEETPPPAPPDKESMSVVSPDGSLEVSFGMDGDGQLFYTVEKDGTAVVERSSLGLTIEEDDFGLLEMEDTQERTVSGSYQNITGKHSLVEYRCNETVATFKAWDFYLDITVRAYDDGYAFRYGIRGTDGGEGTFTVISENTEFALPESSAVWALPYTSSAPSRGNYFSYEGGYTRRSSANLADRYISMPVLYQAGDSDVYSLITESGLIGSGYYGSFLKEAEENEGTGILQTVHSPAGVADPDNTVAYPFESPWRVGITGDLKTVTESELVEKLYDDAEYWKPDDYDTLTEEEQAVYDYDWVEPGVTAWNWLVHTSIGGTSQTDYDMQREYVDLAAEMGWKYTILDGGWNAGLNVVEFRQFVEYAHNKGVKVVVWCDAFSDFGGGVESLLRSKLETWKSYGIDGIKIDFFDGQNADNPTHQGEDIQTIEWYETIYRETARLQMVVNCHGSNKPTGERRIYPHVFNREGIYGNEMTNVDSTVTVNSMFIRGVVGPSDFTPVVKPLSVGLTMAHQMALAVLYECGSPSMADYAETYADADINAFYKSIPSARDDTVFLCGELDGYYCAAVKAGDEWFVAGINSILESEVSVDFSFLGDGTYSAELFTDAAGSTREVTRTEKTVDKSTVETLRLPKNGGFVYRLVKN